jgi:hypothetical protein
MNIIDIVMRNIRGKNGKKARKILQRHWRDEEIGKI